MTTATKNKRGFSYQLPEIGKKFIEQSHLNEGPVMDIGAAYGVATIPALAKGLEVVALDINPDHLEELKRCVNDAYKHRLSTLECTFPHVDFPENHFQSIYISQVFPFLSPKEIELAAKKIHSWLKPGGRLYVVSFTPYLKHCESYIPIYEQKKENGHPWAGFIDNLPNYSKNNPIADQLPQCINHIDAEDLNRVFSPYFKIEQLSLFGDPMNHLPEWIKFDGRERVGMIAQK